MQIPVNNNRTLQVELTDQKLTFTAIDSNGNIERKDSIIDADIVLLYDYLIDRLDNKKQIF
jgi:hypothetical protein